MANFVGKSLGHYLIIEKLGEGGMATVFKARDTNLNRIMAVKVIRREAFPPEQIDILLKRFQREATALAQLVHPYIVNVIDYGSYEGSPYLVMNFLPGGTLKEKLGNPLPWQEAVRLLIPVARALQFAHARGIVHRDVKPSNILLTESGDPMLTDFGIAKILESSDAQTLTGTGVGIGTPEYMAPEQWAGKVSPQTDVYALGVVLYELLTGKKPYTADTPAEILLKQATEPLPRPSSFVQDLPQEIEQILDKAVAKNPADRYPQMQDFANAMEGLLRGRTEAQPAAPLPGKAEKAVTEVTVIHRLPEAGEAEQTVATRPPLARSWTLWAGAAAVVVIAGLGLAFGLRLIPLTRPHPTATLLPTLPPATATPAPTLAPSATATPPPTLTPAPTATATPLLRLGQSLTSKPFSYGLAYLFLSPDGESLWVGSSNPNAHVLSILSYKLSDLSLLKTIQFPQGGVAPTIGVPYSAWQFMAVGFSDGSAKIISNDGTTVQTFPGSGSPIVGLVVSPDGRTVTFGNREGSIQQYEISSGKLLGEFKWISSARTLDEAISPDSQTGALGMSDGSVHVVRSSDGSPLQTLSGISLANDCLDFDQCLVFSPDGKSLAASTSANTLQLWSLSDGSLQATFKGQTSGIASIAFSPDGRFLASGARNGTILLWRISDGSVVSTFTGHKARVTTVLFTPNDQLLASASEDGTVRLWGIIP